MKYVLRKISCLGIYCSIILLLFLYYGSKENSVTFERIKINSDDNDMFNSQDVEDRLAYQKHRSVQNVKETDFKFKPAFNIKLHTVLKENNASNSLFLTNDMPKNESVIIINPPKGNEHLFAAFGVTTPRDTNFFYAFNAPLTVRAWKRIGYDVIVFIIGDYTEWTRTVILKYVLNEIIALKAVVIFLNAKTDNEVLMSQASRIFSCNYFHWKHPNKTFIVTTDADLWPLKAAAYEVPKKKKVPTVNSDCCGSFDHKSHKYKLLPMANIVADVSTWKQMVNTDGFFPRSPDEIIDYFFREFGQLALEKTKKMEYIGWYMDQRILSYKLFNWVDHYGGDMVEFVARDVGRDRIDVNYWIPWTLHRKLDVHLLADNYHPSVWGRIRPLIRLMYSKAEEIEISKYRESFFKLFTNMQERN